jgi:hypothetical protein
LRNRNRSVRIPVISWRLCTKKPMHKPHPLLSILLTDAPLALHLSEKVRLVRQPAPLRDPSHKANSSLVGKENPTTKGPRHCQSRPSNTEGSGLGPASLSDPVFRFASTVFLSLCWSFSRPRTPRSRACRVFCLEIFHVCYVRNTAHASLKSHIFEFRFPLAPVC